MHIGDISMSAMDRNSCSLRTKPSDRALVFGPSVHQASHGLGTTEREERAVQVAQVVTASTAARTLALGVALNISWLKDTDISTVTVMEKPVNHSDEFDTTSAQPN